MNDTPPNATLRVRKMIQQKTAEERLIMGCSMHEFSRQLVIRSILQREPTISQRDLRREIFFRIYGNDFDPSERDKIVQHLNHME